MADSAHRHTKPETTSPSPQPSPRPPAPASTGDFGSFDCNICLDLARDPVVTACGHLFCWPCLYRWLHVHSTCQDCPVCKALVEEEKVVPIYGRGNVGSEDPRKKVVPGVNIPQRPPGQRPETARPRPANQFSQPGYNFMAGPGPMATARFGNFTLSAGFGLFPALFGFQMQGVPDGTGFSSGFPFGAPTGWQAAAHPQQSRPLTPDQQQDAAMSKLLLIVGILVVICFVFF